MSGHPRRFAAVGVAVLAMCMARSVHAQSEAEKALADTQFREGKDLLAEGKTAQACAKFSQSQQLFPRGGTQLNLALCHEAEGRLATAWADFHRALTFAQRDGREDRVTVAQEHISSLEPKLSWMTIQVGPNAPRGLEVSVDGQAVSQASWNVAVPYEPGSYRLTATAPARQAWTTPFEVAQPGRQTVTVPALVVLAAPEPERRLAPTPAPLPQAAEGGGEGRRTVAWIVGTAGLVGIGVGIFCGVNAVSLKSDSDDGCPGGQCTDDGWSAYESADRYATAANIVIPVSVVAVAAATVLILTASSSTTAKQAAMARRATSVLAGTW